MRKVENFSSDLGMKSDPTGPPKQELKEKRRSLHGRQPSGGMKNKLTPPALQIRSDLLKPKSEPDPPQIEISTDINTSVGRKSLASFEAEVFGDARVDDLDVASPSEDQASDEVSSKNSSSEEPSLNLRSSSVEPEIPPAEITPVGRFIAPPLGSELQSLLTSGQAQDLSNSDLSPVGGLSQHVEIIAEDQQQLSSIPQVDPLQVDREHISSDQNKPVNQIGQALQGESSPSPRMGSGPLLDSPKRSTHQLPQRDQVASSKAEVSTSKSPEFWSLKNDEVNDGSESSSSISAPESSSSLTPKMCKQCGAEIPKGFFFCGQCGAKVEESEPPQPSTPDQVQEKIEVSDPPIPAVDTPSIKLIHIHLDGSEGDSIDISAHNALIGRDHGWEIFQSDPYLSLEHCEVVFQDDQVTLKDLGGVNGIFVKLTRPTSLQFGDFFRAGQQLFCLERVTTRGSQSPSHQTKTLGSPLYESWGRLCHIIGGGHIGRAWLLNGDEMKLGRVRGEIVFDQDRFMSSSHCALKRHGDHVTLYDQGSTNGTFIRIRHEVTLQHQDLILIGQKIFRIQLS
jgi:pSer/pThr/pTyr-binding forkhead associated (FHA) protein